MAAPGRGILTIPNIVSVARLAGVPVFLWLLWGPERPAAAAVLLAVLGATDWVDGYIARRFDMGSELGKVLDPTADRVLLLAAALALFTQDLPGTVDVLLAVVVVREVLIAVATVGLAVAGAARIDVVWAGKAGTLAIMFALPLFLIAHVADHATTLLATLGWLFAVGGIALGWYATAQYVPAARAALRSGRSDDPHDLGVRA
jgi:cardiolipin synthase